MKYDHENGFGTSTAILMKEKKKVLKLSMVTYQFVTGSYIMSEIKNKTIYVLLVHMHLATLIMANSVIIIF